MVKKTSGQLYNRLSVLRAERKWSQQQVADLLHVLSFDVYRDVIFTSDWFDVYRSRSDHHRIKISNLIWHSKRVLFLLDETFNE